MSDRFNDELEDAVFRLMMEKVAYAEGEKLIELNEKLKNDPSADVPKDIQDRCLKRIRKEIKRRERQRTGISTWKVLRFIPIAVVTALFLGLLAYAAFPTVRTTVQNLFLEKNAEYISWKLNDESTSGDSISTHTPSFSIVLSDEYQLIAYHKDAQNEYATYQSKLDPAQVVQINLVYSDVANYTSDIEDIDYYEETKVHNYEAIITEKEGTTVVTWSEPNVPCFVSLNTTKLDIVTVKEIANSINIH